MDRQIRYAHTIPYVRYTLCADRTAFRLTLVLLIPMQSSEPAATKRARPKQPLSCQECRRYVLELLGERPAPS